MQTIAIEFNGQSIDIGPQTTIADLLQRAEIHSKLVAVEVNLEIVPHEEFGARMLTAGDCVEAVTLVGGG